jgi:hypothetical protein
MPGSPRTTSVLLCPPRSVSSVRSSARRSCGRPTNVGCAPASVSSRRPAAGKSIGTTGSSMRPTKSIATGSVTSRSAERVGGAKRSFMPRHDRTVRDAPPPQSPWVHTLVFRGVTGADSTACASQGSDQGLTGATDRSRRHAASSTNRPTEVRRSSTGVSTDTSSEIPEAGTIGARSRADPRPPTA